MSENHDYLFKIAAQPHEFQQIHRLNYQTFVNEIPQHEQNEQGILVDPYHNENTYIICLKETQVVGMIAIRDVRPFSLDKKIGPVEDSLPIETNKLCEIRLLSVDKDYRHGRVFLGLAQFLARYCLKKGYDATVISGTVRQLKLYSQMGFQPFSRLVGTEEAQYQPMYLTKETFAKSVAGRIIKPTVNFLPGPVPIREDVKAALTREPISHRSEMFLEKMHLTQKQLCELTNSRYVKIMLGSGTLANDAIAAQLSLLPNKKGLILVNGEFGARLTGQAARMGLEFDVLENAWGQPFTRNQLLQYISEDTEWIWAVHSETSTGMLNDMDMLKEVAAQNQIKLCMDCISSIGAVPIDLNGVYLASGVSGKAIGAFTGLSFVFHQHPVQPSSKLPKYIDLGMYCEHNSIPYSHSSNLLEALHTALLFNPQDRYDKIKQTYRSIKDSLNEMELKTVTPEQYASPTIFTIEIPSNISSVELGETLYYQGFQLHYESSYLREKNWLQIATLGDYHGDDINKMLNLFAKFLDYENNALLELQK
ncbi:aminotransferase class V-fold PLP-dependent enzyme [Neobacillus sp. LXY-4]|uniref:aminotransferase class V-fold PLP-dependent enzyme n=1 Tax=Neobacillus sp. LXY-4 TaxID=3379826 RepID=UPI003EE30153